MSPPKRRPLMQPSVTTLRYKAHKVAETVFPETKDRYRWLVRHAPSVHMSELERWQLVKLIKLLKKQ